MVCFWNTTLVGMPRYKFRLFTSKHSLLKHHAVSNGLPLYISTLRYFAYLKFTFVSGMK